MVEQTLAGRRLWRVRKVHRYIDAELHEDNSYEAELRLMYDDRIIYRRRWSTRRPRLRRGAIRNPSSRRGSCGPRAESAAYPMLRRR